MDQSPISGHRNRRVRDKRDAQVVVSRKNYELHSSTAVMTPLGGVARMLMKAVLAAKNKTETVPWQHTVEKLRNHEKNKKKTRRHLEDESLENMEQFAFRGLRDKGAIGEDIDFLSPSLFSLHNQGRGLENLTSLPSLVKGFGARDQQEWMNLIMEAAGVVEEADRLDADTIASEERRKDPRKRYEVEIRGKDGVPLYFTKRNVSEMFGKGEEEKIATFERLDLSYSKAQLRELNTTGYAMLTPDQLHMLYGPQSPYSNPEALARLTAMNGSELHSGLERDVHQTAELKKFKIRQKDVTLSPILFTFITLNSVISQPIILSPIVFSPITLSKRLWNGYESTRKIVMFFQVPPCLAL
ncbi:unnamed protein product [Sphagnum compactum]